MASRRAWYVTCDGRPGEFCGNPAEISTESLEVARKLARGQGFLCTKVNGKRVDLCPDCQGVKP